MHPALGLSLALFLVLLNGFFVAAEFALVKIRSTQLTERAREGNRPAKLALHAVTHLDAYLSATQLGITLASIGLGWVGEPAVANLLDPLFAAMGTPENVVHGVSFAIAFTLISMAHIVLGELAPKSWAIQKPEKLTMGVIYPLHWFYVLFRPAISALNGLAGLLLRAFGIRPAGEHEGAHSEEEIRMLVAASGQTGVLNETEVEIAGRVLSFADKTVSDVMIPRVDMVALDVQKPIEENVRLAVGSPYSRFPLIDGDHDNVIGLVHIKDLLTNKNLESMGLSSIQREITRVPPNKHLDDMLRVFQQSRSHLALVLDEYGGTEGLVTLEDVLEELVGEIGDEYDPHVEEIQQLSESEWLVFGRTRLTELNIVAGLNFDSAHETISGLMFEHLEETAKPGTTIQVDGCKLTARRVRGHRILQVHVQKLPPSPAELQTPT